MTNDIPEPRHLVVDHLRVIDNRRYRNRIKQRFLDISKQRGFFTLVDVMHESDNRCCKLQPWPTTHAHLVAPAIAAVSGRNPDDVEAVLAEHEPTIIAAGGEDPRITDARSMLAEHGIHETPHVYAYDGKDVPKGGCDFCSQQIPIAVRYPARDFAVRLPGPGKRFAAMCGAWRACATCRDLVDGGDDSALLERAIQAVTRSRITRSPTRRPTGTVPQPTPACMAAPRVA